MTQPPDLTPYRSPAARAAVRPAERPAAGATARDAGRRRSAGPRLAIAAALVLVWVAVMGLGGPTFGRISEVSSNDQSTFLPASAESTLAGERAAAFRAGTRIPAVIVGEASTADAASALPVLTVLGERLGEVAGVAEVVGPIPSEDGRAVQYLALIASGPDAPREAADVVADLRAVLADPAAADGALTGTVAASADWHVAGPAGLAADLGGAFAGIDGLLLLVALVVVFVILVAVYRSVLLPVLVLLTSTAALCAAILAVYWMARADWIQLNGQAQGILSILVIGATTDYCLLLVARHREELERRERVGEALAAAVRGSFGAISASAATVAAALLILLVSDLNSNRSLGPIAASGIVFAWLAALTLLPALLQLLGRAAFWPTVPSLARAARRAERRQARGRGHRPPQDLHGRPIAGLEEDHGVWTRVAALVARRARPVWTATALVLGVLALGVTQLQASGVAQTDVLLGQSDARDGEQVLAAHFDAGAGSPAEIVAPVADVDRVLTAVREHPGVAEAALEGARGPGAGEPLMRDGDVLISATLTDPGESLAAQRTVESLRAELHGAGASGEVLVGGPAAQALDANTTAQRDLRVVIPLVLGVVLLILMVLLRSVLAPVLLVAATVLSFGTALGVSALVFDHVLGFPGADPTVPLYAFVFLVALGVDYTIFLMTRAREETPRRGTRAAVLHALMVTGGVITSAGVVLAATFAALAVIPLMFMVQLAFIVAFGVLLDTLVVRSLLIPALVRDLGPRVWWPARVR
ncbi:MMPL family transporter [Micrococcus sp.]|uniref:MMPL family transporter n=1 Tax=Micrococcus sp. TaxID=1271 RepID=UPI002A915ADF|nr:MMPL family transporter [Micrococcus sp.]MDY6054906.1 MMPL family transporter [Micrococcus sp.]